MSAGRTIGESNRTATTDAARAGLSIAEKDATTDPPLVFKTPRVSPIETRPRKNP